MTATAHFASRGFFPACLESSDFYDARGDLYSSGQWVRDLSLAQIMAFYWNVETFTLTTTASASGENGSAAYSGTANGTFTLSPLGGTGDWAGMDYFAGNINAWMEVDGSAEYALGQTSRHPRNRVCGSSPYPVLTYALDLSGNTFASAFLASCLFKFIVATDSDNAGRYAIGYYYTMSAPVVDAAETNHWSVGFSSVTQTEEFASGTFTLAGITFPFSFSTSMPSYYDNFTTSGGTVTATSSSFTF